MSRPGVLLLFLVTAAFGAGGFIYGVQWKQRSAGLRDRVQFLQTRVELLEEDAQRLLDLVDRMERAGAVDDPEAVIRRDLELVVSDMRGLKWEKRVPYKIVTREGIADLAREKLRGPPAEAETRRRRMRARVAMGWAHEEKGEIPDWDRIVGRLYDGSASAFYDEEQATMYVARGTALEEASERALLVHELTNALLDQHYDLDAFFAPELDQLWRNSDEALARRALASGDASILTLQYNKDFGSALVTVDGQRTEFGTFAALAGPIGDDGSKEQVPLVAGLEAVFPFTAGRAFCNTLIEGLNFMRINEAYGKPPSSTAEILHPELYSGGFEPQRFGWREKDFQISGREILWSDVAGELGARMLFFRYLLDADEATRAAAGWKGDRFIVFGSAKPGNDAGEDLLWRSEWTSAEEALEFREALGAALRERYALKKDLVGTYDGARFLLLEHTEDGTGVIFVDAGTEKRRKEIRGRLP